MPANVNSLEQLLVFLFRLRKEKIHFTLEYSRHDSIMVIVPAVSSYYEIEFFADGHIEYQSFGPASLVKDISLEDITKSVVAALQG
jgi:hypothetical protein